jgi:hypothetical protein
MYTNDHINFMHISWYLAIREEQGRWRGDARDHRICKQCKFGDIKIVQYYLLVCDSNTYNRNELFPNNTIIYTILKDINLTNKKVIKIYNRFIKNRHWFNIYCYVLYFHVYKYIIHKKHYPLTRGFGP